jgi:hypothetical protein
VLDDERKQALGALLGFVTGFAGGMAFAVVRPVARWVRWPLAGTLAGAAVMAATDSSSAALGTTDPRGWGAAGSPTRSRTSPMAPAWR